jgi:uncharacterized protein involved in exopolysaccharide biosynthesis
MNNEHALEKVQSQELIAVPSYELPDYVEIGFRHWRMVLTVMTAFLLAAVVASLIPKYESEMKVMVTRERIDPLVTAQGEQPQMAPEKVSEEDVNSEIELLNSEDLLEQVVKTTGLDGVRPHFPFNLVPWRRSPNRRTAVAVNSLKKSLAIQPVKKADVIDVRYVASDPHRAAQVLQTLGQLYLNKHLEVHHPPGQFDFFEQQADHYREQLLDTEAKLVDFTRNEGVVSGQIERNNALDKLSQFKASLAETDAAIAETRNQIAALQRQESTTPPRLTTQERRSDNPMLLQQLKSTLLTLQLQRTELLNKYAPTYRLVTEVEAKIAETRATIDAAEHNQLRDQTTDRDPTFEWIRGSLAKANSELKALEAKKAALAKVIAEYEQASARYNTQAMAQQDLLRTAKSQEDNYLLYMRKREEARIADALDKRRILNVAIIQAAQVPTLPAKSLPMYVLCGLLLGMVASLALVFIKELFDPSVHTPRDLVASLQVPVLATMPWEAFHKQLPSGKSS